MVRVKKQLLQSSSNSNTVRIKHWKGKRKFLRAVYLQEFGLTSEQNHIYIYIYIIKWPCSKILISELLNDMIIHYDSQRPGPSKTRSNETRVELTAKCAKFMTADTNMVVADMPQTSNLI